MSSVACGTFASDRPAPADEAAAAQSLAQTITADGWDFGAIDADLVLGLSSDSSVPSVSASELEGCVSDESNTFLECSVNDELMVDGSLAVDNGLLRGETLGVYVSDEQYGAIAVRVSQSKSGQSGIDGTTELRSTVTKDNQKSVVMVKAIGEQLTTDEAGCVIGGTLSVRRDLSDESHDWKFSFGPNCQDVAIAE